MTDSKNGSVHGIDMRDTHLIVLQDVKTDFLDF